MNDLLIKMAMIANELDKKGLAKEADHITRNMLKLSQVNYFANAGIDPNSYTGTAQQNEALRKAIDPSAPDFATAYTKKFGPLSTPQDRISKLTGGASPATSPATSSATSSATSPATNPGANTATNPGVGQGVGQGAGQGAGQGVGTGDAVLYPIKTSSSAKRLIFAQDFSDTPGFDVTPADFPPKTNTPMAKPTEKAPTVPTAPPMATTPTATVFPDIKSLLVYAQTLQNSILQTQINKFNSQKAISVGGNEKKALGELAQEYRDLGELVENCTNKIINLLKNNFVLLSKLNPTQKLDIINRIFEPITLLINDLFKIRREQIDPYVGGFLSYGAGQAGSSLNAGEQFLKNSISRIQSFYS